MALQGKQKQQPKQRTWLSAAVLAVTGGLVAFFLAWNLFVTQTTSSFDTCTTMGSATNLGSGSYQLTPSSNSKTGAIWLPETITLAEGVELEFDIYLGSSNGGADGIALVFHQDTDGTSAIGGGGGYLGATGISPSVGIEFDTWYNGGVDLSQDHLAMYANGNLNNQLHSSICATTSCANIEDGANHQVRFVWNPTTENVKVYFDGEERIDYTGDLVKNIFGGNPWVYMGFTAATGGARNQQSIKITSLQAVGSSTIFPVEWLYVEGKTSGQTVQLSWGTAREVNSDYFAIERSEDGMDFQEIGVVESVGTTESQSDYQFEEKALVQEPQALYYRLRQVDLNGAYEYSQTITVNVAPVFGESRQLAAFPNPATTSTTLAFPFSVEQASSVKVMDLSGKLWKEIPIAEHTKQLEVQLTDLSPGMYILSWKGNGQVLSTRLVKK